MRTRRGFTFTEVMFAVVILGIGFLMIAALLPVAIKTTKESVDETTAASVARAAIARLSVRQGSQGKLFAPTGTPALTPGAVAPFSYFGDPSNSVRAVAPNYLPVTPAAVGGTSPTQFVNMQIGDVMGNLIYSPDSRYAWVGIYSRGVTGAGVVEPSAQLVLIATRCQESTGYSTNDAYLNATVPATLQPKRFTAKLDIGTPGQPQTLTLTPLGGAITLDAVGTGAFAVISNHAARPAANGQILRIGDLDHVDTSGNPVWRINSDYDATSIPALSRPANGDTFEVMIVGKQFINGAYVGNVQDVAAFKAIIALQ
jgi:prepilin-type N-terminal cleavage/methylation domain-containing protein